MQGKGWKKAYFFAAVAVFRGGLLAFARVRDLLFLAGKAPARCRSVFAERCARAEVSGKSALFSRNDRPYALKRTTFQTENARVLWAGMGLCRRFMIFLKI